MANISQATLDILHKLTKAGFEAVIAGGWVRDMIIGTPSKDIDIATSAKIEDIQQLFDNVKVVGRDFGVSLVKHLDEEFEVAVFREDGEYLDGRHPSSVRFCSMKEDAQRRDLTMNALFYDPFNNKVIDFVNGKEDINNKIARFVGDSSKRIAEDHIRILRILRFANRFNFSIDGLSYNACFNNSSLLANTAKERLALEMDKILSQCSSEVFEYMRQTNVLNIILPELLDMIGCEQPPQFHPEGDVWNHTMLALDEVKKLEPSLEVLWATLLHDVGKPSVRVWDEKDKRFRFNRHEKKSVDIAKDILSRLKFSNHFQDRVCDLIGDHMRFATVSKMKTSKLKRFIYRSHFDDHIKLHTADCMSSHGKLDNREFILKKVIEFLNEQPNPGIGMPKPLISGTDLINLGLEPGPKFKDILEACMDAQLENNWKDKTDAYMFLLSFINSQK